MEAWIWAINARSCPFVLGLDVVGDDVAGFYGHAVWVIVFTIRGEGRGFVVLGDPADVVATVMGCVSDVEEICLEEVGEEGIVSVLSATINEYD